MINRAVNSINNFGRDLHVEVLAPPVVFGRRNRARDPVQTGPGMHLDPGIDQRPDHALANRVHDVAMDEQTFCRPANASAPCLCVHHHIQRLHRIGGGVDIDVNDPFQMRENRHAGLALDQPDKTFAAPGHDHINRIRHRQHRLHQCK